MANEDDGLQQGGTRGSSSPGGPESSGEPEQDAGPMAPLPPGTTPEDYVGGTRPHKTRNEGETGGASGVKNEVL